MASIKGVKIYALFPFILVMIFIISDITMKDRPKLQLTIDEAESLLDSEYVLISSPPQAVQNSHKKTKRTTVLITSGYVTKLGYEEIRKYYDDELKEHGWQFYKEEKVTNWGEYAGMALYYKNGELIATIEYHDNPKYNYGCTYSFDMSWGIPEEAL